MLCLEIKTRSFSGDSQDCVCVGILDMLNEPCFLSTELRLLFAAVDKAYKLLLDPEHKKRVVDVIHAGKEYIEHNVRGLSMILYVPSHVSPVAFTDVLQMFLYRNTSTPV